MRVPGSPVGSPVPRRPAGGALARPLAALLLLAACAASAMAQDVGDGPGRSPDEDRAATILVGAGTSMGWFGGQGEAYLGDGRWSLLAGLGYAVTPQDDHPEGVAFAAGSRRYSAGANHRTFVGLTAGLLLTTSARPPGQPVETGWHYGPAVMVGYQYTADGGLTALLSAGIGYAFGDVGDQSAVVPAVDVGVGYTWR